MVFVQVLGLVAPQAAVGSSTRQWFRRNRKEDTMTKKADVYKCESCEMVVTILKDGKGPLSCCDKEMKEVTPDEAKRLTYGMQRPGTP